MPVERVEAFKTSSGAIFPTKQEANTFEALNIIDQTFDSNAPDTWNRMGVADWLLRNARPLCAALAPIADDVKA